MLLLTLCREQFAPAFKRRENSEQHGDARIAPRPSQKVYRQRSGPPPRVRAVSPMPASPWRESSGTESSSAGAPSGGIPAAKSERLCSLPHTRGRLFLAKAVEPHDLTATLRLVGVRVRLRLRRFRIGGDGHRHAGLR